MSNYYDTSENQQENLNKGNVPKEAWEENEKIDMETGTNRYMQMHMEDTLNTVGNEVTKARENDYPFNTLVVLLARNGKDKRVDTSLDEGIERYSTHVGSRDYAVDLSVQFAIDTSKDLLSDLIDNNPDLTKENYRKLEKGIGFNIIKRVIDEFNLTDEDIDLNSLKGKLSDAVNITDEFGNNVDLD